MEVIDITDDGQRREPHNKIGVGKAMRQRIEKHGEIKNHTCTEEYGTAMGAAFVGTVDDMKFLCHKEIQ